MHMNAAFLPAAGSRRQACHAPCMACLRSLCRRHVSNHTSSA